MPKLQRLLQACLLGLPLLVSACQTGVGSLSLAVAFPAPFALQAIPAGTRQIAVQITTPGQPVQEFVLTPAQSRRTLARLSPGPRQIVALAFDGQSALLAGARVAVSVLPGQNTQAELELQSGFVPDPALLAHWQDVLGAPPPAPSPTPSAGGGNTAPTPTPQPLPTDSPQPTPSPLPSATPLPQPSPTPTRSSGGGSGGGSGGNTTPSPSPLNTVIEVTPGQSELPPIAVGGTP